MLLSQLLQVTAATSASVPAAAAAAVNLGVNVVLMVPAALLVRAC